MRPRILAAAMDLFCFYRGRLLPGLEGVHFAQENIILCTKSFLFNFQALLVHERHESNIQQPFFYKCYLLLFTIGSIIDCCRQGQRIGNRLSNDPVCIEKNINYNLVGRVTKKMCKSVFMSCCHNSAMEQYCKAGVQASM